MLEQVGAGVTFYAFFVANKTGKTGLTVTVDVYKNGAAIVAAGAATEVGAGIYSRDLAGASVDTEGYYLAVFKTADATVDQQHIPSLWVVGKGGIENLDAAISSRAQAGDVMTLPSDYDAAKTAAQPSDVAGLALEAGLETHISTVLDAYDPPTKMELDAAVSPLALEETVQAITPAPSAAELWAHTPRTLTQTVAQVTAVMQGAKIIIHRGDTCLLSLVNLPSLGNARKVWFTAKVSKIDPDAQALIQMTTSQGLLIINKRAATDADGGSIELTGDNFTEVLITIDEQQTSLLPADVNGFYDIQAAYANGVFQTVAQGTIQITADVTQSLDMSDITTDPE